MLNAEVLAFVLYFVLMLAIGVFFFFKERGAGEKEYFLGGRHMGPWVTAMSAQASDMSAWLLMGLPGSILAFGFGQIWIGIGLALFAPSRMPRTTRSRFRSTCLTALRRRA